MPQLAHIVLGDFRGGLNTKDPPESLNQNEFQDGKNFLFSHTGHLEPRLGLDQFESVTPGSTDLKGTYVFEQEGGTKLVLIRVGDKLYYWSTGTNAWVEITKSSGNAFDTDGDRTTWVTFRGNCIIADGYNFMAYDGTTLSDLQFDTDWNDCSSDFATATTYQFNSTNGDKFFPYYLAVHDNRLLAGNLRVVPSGGDAVLFPTVVLWSESLDFLDWETDTGSGDVMNYLYLDYEVTGFVSATSKAAVFTKRRIYTWEHDTGFYGTYYYPTVRVLAEIGALPHTMCQVNSDIWFANEIGVYSLARTEKFGDLEAARLSYKIDPIFEDNLSTAHEDNLSGFYVPWRDEYWLNIPTAATAYITLVAKSGIADERGLHPWSKIIFDHATSATSHPYRDFAIDHTDQLMYVAAGSGTYKLYKYYGHDDDGTAITADITSKLFGTEDYDRKRIRSVEAQCVRYGQFATQEYGTLSILDSGGDTQKSVTLTFTQQAGAYYGSAIYGTDLYGADIGWQSIFLKKRLSLHLRTFAVKWTYSSAVSGGIIHTAHIDFNYTRRGAE